MMTGRLSMNTTQQKFSSLEHRRIQGGKLIEQGFRNCEIVEILKCSLSAAKRWRKLVDKQGVEALAPKPRPGRTPKLNEKQIVQLKHFLKKGASEFGFENAMWTSRRVRQLIQDQFDVNYSSRQVRRILCKIGYSPKESAKHSHKHSHLSMEHLTVYKLPHIKKTA